MNNNINPEFWVLVPGRDDYMVSNTGKIKSYHRQWRRWIDKSLREDSKGYLSVGISSGTKSTSSARVHRLVASAFIPNPNNLPYVNHKDNNPKNNDASNLEWCDPKYNMEYSFFSGERVSGQAKPVRLYINNKFFSNYSSIEHCSREFSTNKKFFNLSAGRTTQLDGMLRIEKIPKIIEGEPLNKKALKQALGKLSSKPLMHGEESYQSIKDFAERYSMTQNQARWICSEKKEFNDIPIECISIAEYIRINNLINW